jgi:putative transposase
LEPTPAQHEVLRGFGHTRRYLYNACIAAWLLAIDLRVRPDASRVVIDELRACFDWVRVFPSQGANEVVRDVERAFANWADSTLSQGRPRFEKRGARLRFSLPGQATEVRHLSRKCSEVWVTGVGWVRFRRHRALDGVVRNATFSYSPSGGWEVSFGIAAKEVLAPPNGLPGVGVDFGVACSAFCSDESSPRLMPATLTPGEHQRLLGLERRKARQLAYAKKHNHGRYSKRLRKTITSIADLKARQARRRRDFTHKLTSDLAKNHGFVATENLTVKAMTASAEGTVEEPGTNVSQKAGLNRGILDNTPGERSRQLDYKCKKLGSLHVPVNPWGTSQTCPSCTVRDPANRPGCGRAFACVHCGHQAHADKAAAINIERRGAHELTAAGRAVDSTGRRKPSHASGVGGSVKRVAPAGQHPAGRVESTVA